MTCPGDPPLCHLARRAQGGAASDWADLHRTLKDFVFWAVQRRFSSALRRQIEPRDLAQTAWLVIFQKLPKVELRDDASLLGWIRSVLENLATDLERRLLQQRRDHRREVDLASVLRELDGDLPAALQTATAEHVDRSWVSQECAEADAAIERLNEPDREAFLRVQVLGCSVAEAARQLNVPESTVRRRVERARATLAAMLGAASGGEAREEARSHVRERDAR